MKYSKFMLLSLLGLLIFLSGCSDDVIEEKNPCEIKPVQGPCEALIYKFYYDQESQSCEEFFWGGCGGVVPFETMEDCKVACEDNDLSEPSSVYVSSFDDCVEATNAVLASFPEQCVHNGMTFINEEQNLEPGKFNTGCSIDGDCIPLPYDCHAHSCITIEHESLFTPIEPLACTTIFISTAAYSSEDCVCLDGFCVNKNLDNVI